MCESWREETEHDAGIFPLSCPLLGDRSSGGEPLGNARVDRYSIEGLGPASEVVEGGCSFLANGAVLDVIPDSEIEGSAHGVKNIGLGVPSDGGRVGPRWPVCHDSAGTHTGT